MVLKPQDVLVLLKLVALGKSADWSYNRLALELGMSPAEVHAAIKRALKVRLAVRIDDQVSPNIRNLEEFLIHGLPYFLSAERGQLTRGMPTMTSAPPLSEHFGSDDGMVVWPDAKGDARGEALTPLYRSVPAAARRDAALYELLVLADAIRGGRARERQIAGAEIKKRLRAYEADEPESRAARSGGRATRAARR